jgi:digeranylgeranylglycerophospholipid reductase
VPIQCAGIMSQKLVRIVDLDPTVIQNHVKVAKLISPDNSTMVMKGREQPIILNRAKFDQVFYHRGVEKGVTYYFNEKFITYKRIKNNGVKVITDKRIIHAKLIVGCDGPLSKVAKLNGVSHNFLYGMQVVAHYTIDMNVTEMHFDPKWKEMFGWVIPQAKGICRIGLAAKSDPKDCFDSFLSKIGIKKEDIISKQGGLIPFGYPRRVAFDRTLLLGDSACMVKATTGGGVVMLLSAAKIARTAIKNAIHNQDYSKKFLVKNYEQAKSMIMLRAELKVHYFIRLVLQRFTTHDFNWFFKLYTNTNMKTIIEKYADMDFPRRLLLKLLINRTFDRFLVHFLARNLGIIPQFISLLVGRLKIKQFKRLHS